MASMQQSERKVLPPTLKAVELDHSRHRGTIGQKDHQDIEGVHHVRSCRGLLEGLEFAAIRDDAADDEGSSKGSRVNSKASGGRRS